MSYSDRAEGIVIIRNYCGGKFDSFPCEIRFGNHPNKGGYEMCLYLRDSYDQYGDDKFGISEIKYIDETVVLCHMNTWLCKKGETFGTEKVTVDVSVGFDKLKNFFEKSRPEEPNKFEKCTDEGGKDELVGKDEEETEITKEKFGKVELVEKFIKKRSWWKFW